MKKGYLAISYSDRKKFDNEVDYLLKALSKSGVELLVFVDKYCFKRNQEKEMMKVAFEEIDNSDFLIAELTKKSIGVGIEIGYAYSKKKPIFYLRRKGAEYSTTASGCSKHIIEYENKIDLGEKITSALNEERNN
ncbi:MAG: nucleoside 2-deoxyribosyltransferase [Flavobacteriaceae bacterium]|nr:nucleoside 2-deoxyribosyltransferase [Flavobacteriaceae bacterium]